MLFVLNWDLKREGIIEWNFFEEFLWCGKAIDGTLLVSRNCWKYYIKYLTLKITILHELLLYIKWAFEIYYYIPLFGNSMFNFWMFYIFMQCEDVTLKFYRVNQFKWYSETELYAIYNSRLRRPLPAAVAKGRSRCYLRRLSSADKIIGGGGV